MNNIKTMQISIIIFLSIAITFSAFSQQLEEKVDEQDLLYSPYAGQEQRWIKSLSQDDVEGLLNGHGTPFGAWQRLESLMAIRAQDMF